MNELGAVFYVLAALASFVPVLLILGFWRSKLFASWIIAPLLFNAIWSVMLAWASFHESPITLVGLFVEIIRALAWAIFLMAVLRYACRDRGAMPAIYTQMFYVSILLGALLLASFVVMSTFKLTVPVWLGYDFRIIVQIAISLISLVFVEQILRNTISQERWGIKFFCIGLGAIFAYDFYLYTDALLFRELDPDIWYARGLAEVLAIGLVTLGIQRMPNMTSRLLFSRQIIFYTTAIALAGLYLLIISLGGYYIMIFGGDWGGVIRNIFIFSCILLFVVMVFSGQMRARLRVFVDKHFLNDKYDYREEWLAIIREMSSEDEAHGGVERRIIRVLANIMDCPSGALWVRKNKSCFEVDNYSYFPEFKGLEESTESSFCQFLENWQWVISIDEYRMRNDQYQGLELPEWLLNSDKAWLVVPLMLQSRLYAFVVLSHPRVEKSLGWEDIDLLKTMGRQLATHLAHSRSASALAQSRQFEAFNRLSAYVIHDLKNLVSQLDLVVKNAAKHKHNPAFMDDAVDTVGNAVNRMNKLLLQLRAGFSADGKVNQVDIRDIVAQIIRDKSGNSPVPIVEGEVPEGAILGNGERLVSVLGHLVQNAQDATPSNGKVILRASVDDHSARLEIEDNGCGMSESFIRERLFKPFDTTKGLTGMGIGAHESKAYIEELGGSLDVSSEPDKGTLFVVKLPLVKQDQKLEM